MSKVIAIMGESGAGKTTSMRNLDPETTFYIDCDKKGLSWKGWKKQYIEGKNYYKGDAPTNVMQCLQAINANKKFEGIKTVIVDTLNGIMVAEEMRNVKVAGYGKWTDLASYIYEIVDYALSMRDDLTVIFICHSETISEGNGMVFTRIKTNGRKLDKIVLESKFTTVLLAECKDGKYILHTHADRSSVKSPLGAFEENEIENDVVKVINALEEY